jgi:hypothetical protein
MALPFLEFPAMQLAETLGGQRSGASFSPSGLHSRMGFKCEMLCNTGAMRLTVPPKHRQAPISAKARLVFAGGGLYRQAICTGLSFYKREDNG